MENPNGAVQGNAQNNPTANVPRTRSTFDLKYHFFDTHRFGEYHPHYVEEGVKEDILPIRSSHQVLSYTLKAPLMQNISLKKDYFLVPMEAILPLNWEKFFDNPVRGDDVSVDVGPTVEDFWKKVGTAFNALRSSLVTMLADAGTSDAMAFEYTIRFFILGEYFYSNGSLMASLGCHGAPYINCFDNATPSVRHDYDFYFDKAISTILQSVAVDDQFSIVHDSVTYNVLFQGVPTSRNQIDFRHFLSLVRDNPVFQVISFPSTNTLKSDLTTLFGTINLVPNLAVVPFNTSRLWAYQLCCAHYYSNDHIDFVYSAELYRQLIGNYAMIIANQPHAFVRNGIGYQYDYLSSHYLTFVLEYIPSGSILAGNDPEHKACLGYLSALFGYRRSLRYQDYFTGSRAQPLAVGSTGVAVSNNSVDVVDVTRNIQKQRFLNAVNRVRHNFEGYLQGIFGGDTPAPDYHNPFFLASTEDTVYGAETENTGNAQVSAPLAITSNLRSNGSKYMIEIHCDRPCVVLGLTHYDIPRVYDKSMEREFLVKDRFDMFNPFMQFIGDQPIYLQELGINPGGSQINSMNTFAYTLRHMEFKQRFNQAAGGFVSNLPGFAFLAVDWRGTQNHINPDWIRSVCSEFDSFYVSLNGWSNGSYFHFIVDNFNDCTGSRPMAFAPSIL